jgi:hypothetical protein
MATKPKQKDVSTRLYLAVAEPPLTEFFAQQKVGHEGGESNLARATPFTGQFGHGEFLGIVVPLAEITKDIVILLFTLPLVLVVLFTMIDVRVGRKSFSFEDFMKFGPGSADDR